MSSMEAKTLYICSCACAWAVAAAAHARQMLISYIGTGIARDYTQLLLTRLQFTAPLTSQRGSLLLV